MLSCLTCVRSVFYVRTDKQALMEKIEEIERQQVPTFQGRQYLNNVWQCYVELLSLNVGVKNIEPVIRCFASHSTA